MNASLQARSWLRCLVAAITSLFVTHAYAQESPWETIARYPGDIDAAMVLDRAAERVLLNDSGLDIRSTFTSLGLFAETDRAWSALAETFGINSDQAIEALFSGRVVIMWDHIDELGINPLGLLSTADTGWVLSAEVTDSFVRQVRRKIKPVPRRIHAGKPVYAIEHGRFHLAVIDAKDTARASGGALMIVASKRGAQLVNRVIDSMLPDAAAPAPSRLAIQAAAMNPKLRDGWVAAAAVAVDDMIDATDIKPERQPVATMVVWAGDSGWDLSIKSDAEASSSDNAAPVGLLGAVGGDALLAVANAGPISISSDSFSFDIGFMLERADPNQGQNQPTQSTGSLMLISDDSSPVMTVMSSVQCAPESYAQTVDAYFENALADPATAEGPSFQGKFPSAIRTHLLDDQTPEAAGGWLDDKVQVSWISGISQGEPQVIFAFGPKGTPTSNRVRWLNEAARKLQAIPGHATNPAILSQGFARPQKLSPLLLGNTPGVIAGILDAVDHVRWEIRKAQFGLSAEIGWHWSADGGAGILGRRD